MAEYSGLSSPNCGSPLTAFTTSNAAPWLSPVEMPRCFCASVTSLSRVDNLSCLSNIGCVRVLNCSSVNPPNDAVGASVSQALMTRLTLFILRFFILFISMVPFTSFPATHHAQRQETVPESHHCFFLHRQHDRATRTKAVRVILLWKNFPARKSAENKGVAEKSAGFPEKFTPCRCDFRPCRRDCSLYRRDCKACRDDCRLCKRACTACNRGCRPCNRDCKACSHACRPCKRDCKACNHACKAENDREWWWAWTPRSFLKQ